MRRALVIAVAVFAGGCSPSRDAARPGDAGARPVVVANGLEVTATRSSAAEAAGAQAVENDCQSCHARGMLEQQALSPAQWSAEVKKMRGWGAPVEDEEEPALLAWLVAHQGTDAAPAVPAAISPAEAEAAIAPTPDGPLARGEARRGASLFASQCAPCHGADAGGGVLGVRLADRPGLWRAADFAHTVRVGRGRMPAFPDTRDADLAAILAHLRTLAPDPTHL